MANAGIAIFTHQVLPANVALIGDLNETVADINAISFFNKWNDIAVNDAKVHGVDHILTELAATPVLGAQLDFVSDAYHYPIAGDLG